MSNTTNLIYQGVTGTEFIATVVLTTTDATILALPSIDGNITFDFWAYLYPPVGQNEVYSNVPNGSTTSTYGLAPMPRANQNYDPSELLPKDVNSQWAQLNPAGSADFKNVNLLKAGSLIGIDTIGSTLRNANLQERSEPPNPTTSVSPWLNTTIEPDLMRLPLEIGTRSGQQ